MNPTKRILGHRGASASHPENTVAAVVQALRDGADGVEIDVRLTADGVPVVFHDDETTKLTGESGTIEDRTLAEVQTLAVRGEPVPTLAEVVTAMESTLSELGRGGLAPATFNVELKPTGSAKPLILACAPVLAPWAGLEGALVVSSFDPRVVHAALDAGVPWRMAYLYEDLLALKALPHLRPPPGWPLDLHPWADLITAEHVAEYAQPGRQFRFWTVDDPERAAALLDVHPAMVAVISNDPAKMRRGLAALAVDLAEPTA